MTLASPAAFGAEASLDGLRLHYLSRGTGKQVVAFIHGWTCDHTFWSANAPPLEARRRVLLIDLPGHGASDKPRIAYTPSLFARAVEAVMRHAGVDKAVLVGHSMGVYVIRQFAREFPAKLAAAVMVDGPVPRSTPDFAARERFIDQFRDLGFREKYIENMFVEATRSALRDQIKKKMLAAPEHVAVGAMASMSDPAAFRLDPIPAPVLFLFARRPTTAADYEQFLRGFMPKLEFQPWDGAGHFLMMEQPERFNRMLVEFLDRHGL